MENYLQVLQGCLNELPQEETNTVRVFFSSTFTDMMVERNLLMKNVVPYLRDYCKKKDLDFQVVDMRWGVREDASIEHTTTDICLREIKICQETSAGPNFVAFLGDRYGSRQLPNSIPVTEFRTLRRLASWMDIKEFGLLEKWYLLDTNAVPPVYQIQPITALLPYYSDKDPRNRPLHDQNHQTWEKDQTSMLHVLRTVADKAFSQQTITADACEKYHISVTHDEVKAGILKYADAEDKVLVFCRSLTDINVEDNVAKRYIDCTPGEKIDQEAHERLMYLKTDELSKFLPPSHIIQDAIPWTSNGVDEENNIHAAYLREFCETFRCHMVDMINKSFQSTSAQDSKAAGLYKEVLHHLHFCVAKCEIFSGRENELEYVLSSLDKTETSETQTGKSFSVKDTFLEGEQKERKDNEFQEERAKQMEMYAETANKHGITFCYGDSFDDYTADPQRDLREETITLPKVSRFKRPVVINGASGSGKTALMAKIVQLSKKWIPESVCVVRFLGTSTSSLNIREVLTSIINQLWVLYDISPPAGLELQVDFNYTCRYLQALLWQIKSQERPLFLLLDSVDQLTSTDYAHSMAWLPYILPPEVHLFVSVATDHTMCLSSLKANLPFQHHFLDLQPLGAAAAERMIRAMCHRKSRTLTASQRAILQQTHGKSQQTLHLKLITDKALSWPSHKMPSDFELGATVEDAIGQLFENLEKNHGQIIVSKALGYLTLADQGLTDGEMEDILSLDDEVLQDTYLYHLPPDSDVIRLPPSLWIRIKNDIHDYLTFEQTGKVKFSKWYHRHFREAARKRYIRDETRVQMHCAMADYFLGTWSDQPKPLELYKGKKGSYPSCLRGVPAQPLQQQGEMKVFNLRKLQELPHHLAESDNWEEFHRTVACSLDWLLASCQTVSTTILLSQFRAMLCRRSDALQKEVQDLVKDVQLVYDVMVLGIDYIRRDPMNLPLQLVGQLSPNYRGSTGVERLIQQSKGYLQMSPQALMVPHNAHFPAPRGQLLSSINLRMFLMGDDRMSGPSLCANEEKQLLHAVEWSLNNNPDSLLTLDYANSCTIIRRERLPFFVHSLYYAGVDNRFLVMKIYDVKSKWLHEAKFSYQLFEGGTLMAFAFDKLVSALSVASHGLSIALSYKEETQVRIGTPDTKTYTILIKHHLDLANTVALTLFTPDATTLVVVDSKTKISVWHESQKVVLPIGQKSEKQSFHFTVPQPEDYIITNSNLLVYANKSYGSQGVNVLDIASGEQKLSFVSDKLQYAINIILLEKHQQFVLVGTTEEIITNGNVRKPALLWNLDDGTLASEIPNNCAWTALRLTGDDVLICLACNEKDSVICILSLGPRSKPFPVAAVLQKLDDHNKSIFQLLPLHSGSLLISASTDNTVKTWDLENILKETISQRSKNENVTEQNPNNVTQNSVGCLGKTSCIAVTREDKLGFFGTEKGVVACCKLTEGPDHITTIASDLPPVHLMCQTSSGDHVIVVATSILAVFECRNGHLLYKMAAALNSKVSCLAEGGGTAVAGHEGMQGTALVWDVVTGTKITTLQFLYSFSKTAVNKTGTKVVVHMFEFPIVMDVTNNGFDQQGMQLSMENMDIMMSGCACMCVSPDDSLVAACATDGSIRVISMDNRYLHRMQKRSSSISATFSPDSKHLVTGGFRSIYVWNMGSGQLECKMTRHQDFVTSLIFVTEGRCLVSTSIDMMLVVWDYTTRTSLCTVTASCQLHTAGLTPDLSHLVYIPDRTASLAVLQPNAALQKFLFYRKEQELSKALKQVGL